MAVKSVPFSSLHVTYARVKGIDTTKAGKLNRGFIRSNFEVIAKAWPELRASQKINRDGNRYPQTVPAHVADAIIKRDLAKLAQAGKRASKPRAPKVTPEVTAQEVTAE